jgi:hypothetical protein
MPNCAIGPTSTAWTGGVAANRRARQARRGIGLARFVRIKGEPGCRAAVAVTDDWQGS